MTSAGLDAGLVGRAVLGRLGNERTLGRGETDAFGDILAHILDADAENPRVTVPESINCAVTCLTTLAGMAKAMPTLPPLGRRWQR